MLKMEIALDEKRIVEDGHYDVTKMKSYIDSLMQDLFFDIEDEGVYAGRGTPQDYAYCLMSINKLKNQEWFMTYVSKWLFINKGRYEDFVEQYRAKNRIRS